MSFGKDFDHEGERLRVQLKSLGDDRFEATVGDRSYELVARSLGDGRVRFELDGETYRAVAAPMPGGDLHVALGERTFVLKSSSGRRSASDAKAGDGVIEAPMTGTVLKVAVQVGDTVAASDTVAVVSAMKMEHKLLAEVDGVVAEVSAAEGDTVDQGAVVMRIEPTLP